MSESLGLRQYRLKVTFVFDDGRNEWNDTVLDSTHFFDSPNDIEAGRMSQPECAKALKYREDLGQTDFYGACALLFEKTPSGDRFVKHWCIVKQRLVHELVLKGA